MKMIKAFIPCSATVVIFLAGCHVGPRYSRPQALAPAAYQGADGASLPADTSESIGDLQWSSVFPQPELQGLIREALAGNLDLKIAAERVLEAQQQVRITHAQQLPSVEVSAAGGGPELPASTFGYNGDPATMGGLSLSGSWALDFWGSYRKQTEVAKEQLLAQEWARRAVRLSLVEQVASTYLQLRSLDMQLDLARQTFNRRQQSVQLMQTLESHGSIPLSDLRQAEVLLYNASSAVPRLEEQVQQTENTLQLLLGKAPGKVVHESLHALDAPPVNVPVGLPSQLLERRPDIQQAEAQLKAANAQVGIARARFFPQISLSASEGVGGGSLSSFADPASAAGYALGQLVQPIFTGGRIRGQYELSKKQKEEMLLNYQSTILTSLRDVSNALIATRKQRAMREEQEKLVHASKDAARLATLRYQAGAASYLEVLTAETSLFDAQLAYVQAQQNESAALVQLYAALGGGWQ